MATDTEKYPGEFDLDERGLPRYAGRAPGYIKLLKNGIPMEPFFPSYIFKMAIFSLIILVALIVLAIYQPMPYSDPFNLVAHLTNDAGHVGQGANYTPDPIKVYPADPLNKPDPATGQVFIPRPDWYFLFLFGLLAVMGKVPDALKAPAELFGAVILPTIIILYLIVLPFIDRNRWRSWNKRPLMLFAQVFTLAVLISLTAYGKSLNTAPAAVKPPSANPTFSADIAPIFKANCASCHISTVSGGLSLGSYASVMKGGDKGVVIKAGDSANSLLYQYITTGVDGLKMPIGGSLPQSSVTTIKTWIDQGAKQ